MTLNCITPCSRSPLISMLSSSSSSSSLQPYSSSSFAPSTCYRCYMPFFVTNRKVMLMTYAINCRSKRHLVRMAPEEEKLTRRSPLDFPIEWERPKPGRRPDIFPQFSPMKTPLPPPMPSDPPEEDEEEEEKKEEEEEPEKEEPKEPEIQ